MNPIIKDLLTPRLNEYIIHIPTVKQQAFLLLDCIDAFYGGAAGGGKSDALLMAALQYVDIPGYNAILMRNTFKNLSKPEGLISRAHEWLSRSAAEWKEGYFYLFPSGATLSFGYLDGPLDHFNYQSAAYQFVGIDEIVQIRRNQALYLFSRLRRLKGSSVPIRFRGASNPPQREQIARGNWVKERYVDKNTKSHRIFIPAKMNENKHLDVEEYKKTFALSGLDPITRRQLEDGDWEIKAKGNMFQRQWFNIVDVLPLKNINWVRYWDMAGTEKTGNNNPCFTCGVKIGVTFDGLFFIDSVIRGQFSPMKCEQIVRQTAIIDGIDVAIWMEQEPGSSGKGIIDHYRRNILRGFYFQGDPVNKAKTIRWGPLASQAEAGCIFLMKKGWLIDFLDEIELAPDGEFNDQVDAMSGGFNKLVGIGAGVPPSIQIIDSINKDDKKIEIWEGDKIIGYEEIG